MSLKSSSDIYRMFPNVSHHKLWVTAEQAFPSYEEDCVTSSFRTDAHGLALRYLQA